MSSTNKTLTIELSQYISTDKPTYLSDYNGDMLKIDNAFAADRDNITTAQNTADGAVEKADANKESIDTLNNEINGNPETPAVPGISQRLTSAEGDIDTLQALIGDGTAIPTGQTVISGIIALEDSIAPVENGSTFGASYEIGQKFNRGGVLYEALVPITSGTAWSAVTVGTDYKQADRITKQINDAAAAIPTKLPISGYYAMRLATATADGVKTRGALIDEAVNIMLAAMNDTSRYALRTLGFSDGAFMHFNDFLPNPKSLFSPNFTNIGYYGYTFGFGDLDYAYQFVAKTSGSVIGERQFSINQNTDFTSLVPTEGVTVTIIYEEII